jgi:hypothetical protein
MIIIAILENCPSRMTGKSKVVNTHSHKYYQLRPKIPNGITMAMVITTLTFLNIIPQGPESLNSK